MNIEQLVKTLGTSIEECELNSNYDGIPYTIWNKNKIENLPIKYLANEIHTISLVKKEKWRIPYINIEIYEDRFLDTNKFKLIDFFNVYVPVLNETFHWINVKITNSSNQKEFEDKYLNVPFRLLNLEIKKLDFNLKTETIEIQVKR